MGGMPRPMMGAMGGMGVPMGSAVGTSYGSNVMSINGVRKVVPDLNSPAGTSGFGFLGDNKPADNFNFVADVMKSQSGKK